MKISDYRNEGKAVKSMINPIWIRRLTVRTRFLQAVIKLKTKKVLAIRFTSAKNKSKIPGCLAFCRSSGSQPSENTVLKGIGLMRDAKREFEEGA